MSSRGKRVQITLYKPPSFQTLWQNNVCHLASISGEVHLHAVERQTRQRVHHVVEKVIWILQIESADAAPNSVTDFASRSKRSAFSRWFEQPKGINSFVWIHFEPNRRNALWINCSLTPWTFHSVIHFHARLTSGEGREGKSSIKTRKTSWSTTNSDGPAASTPKRDQARSEM